MANIINGELVKALAEFQRTVPLIPKDKSGQVGHAKTKYADLATVCSTIREPLAANGLAFTQVIEPNVLKTIVMHISGGMIESDIPLQLDGLDPQKRGLLITYMRRYSLTAILGIVADDDDDAAGISGRNAVAPVSQTPQGVESPRENGAQHAFTRRVLALISEVPTIDDRRGDDGIVRDGLRTITRKAIDEAKAENYDFKAVSEAAIARAETLKKVLPA